MPGSVALWQVLFASPAGELTATSQPDAAGLQCCALKGGLLAYLGGLRGCP